MVLIARGDTFMTARSSCDFATPMVASCMLRTLHLCSAAGTDSYWQQRSVKKNACHTSDVQGQQQL